jgi:hypothetical protein
MLDDLATSFEGYSIALLILLTVFAGMIGLQTALRYTKPNIGYHCRKHRGHDRTFFIRNLDSVHYRRPLHIIVSGLGLNYVAVHAGPWCIRRPTEIETVNGKLRVRVVFETIPEDASFALRVVARRGDPSIEIDPASPLQSRSFAAPLPTSATITRIHYYLIRYLFGFVGLVAVFLLSLWWFGYAPHASDAILIGVGFLVSIISFTLVVPYRGKSTIVGYLGPVDTVHFWGDRRAVLATASGKPPVVHDSAVRLPEERGAPHGGRLSPGPAG